jgi:hypothetical protein
MKWPAYAFAVTTLLVSSLAHGSIMVNSDAPGSVQNEVSLTINANPQIPVNGLNLIAAYNDFVAGPGLGISFSTDSGATWTDRQLSVPLDPLSQQQLGAIFDPVSGSNTQGTLFAGYVATTGSAGGPSGLFVDRSTDGGNSWSGPATVVLSPAGTPGTPPHVFNDKPHLATDTFASSPNKDNVYLAWIQDDEVNPQSNIVFSRSIDGGLSYSPLVTVNDHPNLGVPGGDEANGPNVAVAPNGTVYVAWLDVDVTNANSKPGTLYIDKSLDGGQTFGTDVLVRQVTTLPNNLTTAGGVVDARSRGFPVIATDPNDATGQTVYMVYAADPDGPGTDEADIFFVKSTDGGLNWTSPLRVNDDNSTNDQFAPWMSVKANGTIDIVWYDKRNSPNDDQWDVYMAASVDGGNSFLSNRRVTAQSYVASQSTAGQPWLGEYLAVTTDSTSAYIGFTTSYNDKFGDI